MPRISTAPRSFQAYDVEAISNASTVTGRVSRRLGSPSRRPLRWILGVSLAAGLVLVLGDLKSGSGRGRLPRPLWAGGAAVVEEDGLDVDVDDIWHEDAGTTTESGQGWENWAFGSGLGGGEGGEGNSDVLQGKGKSPVQHHQAPDAPPKPHTFVLNEYGDKFIPNYPQDIAPLHPDLSLLPEPSSLFPEVHDMHSFLKPPTFEPFPESRIPEIISEPPAVATDSYVYQLLADDAFSKTWKGPKDWNGARGDVRQVQWDGFTDKSKGWESEAEKKEREDRRDAVKRGFVWAWQKYKDHAWGSDEIKPVSMVPSNPFNNWGASIIDTLDTLLIMGLNDEYNLCRPIVNQLNLHWVGGRDWSQGYVSSEPVVTSEEEETSEEWGVQRDAGVHLPVFETGIRYLGGLIGAYDLSGDQLLLDRATELAGILGRAFNTESGLPVGHMDPGFEQPFLPIYSCSLAEVGSMTLELMRLSQITGDSKWHDLAQRVTDFIELKVIPRSNVGNLIPMSFSPYGNGLPGTFTWGAMADSYYEYLIKAYKLLGGSSAAQQYKRIYEKAVDTAQAYLFKDIEVIPGVDILSIGKLEPTLHLLPEIEHLTCFAGAMLGLGSKLLDRPSDLVDAERFTQSCYWLSAATPTGLQPEVVEFFEDEENDTIGRYENVTLEGFPYFPPSAQEPAREKVEFVERLKGSPPGSRKVVGRGINRPETIESIFYMYRLTGDRKWQEKGWKMFVSWSLAAKVDGGMSSIHDVTQAQYYHSDNMESFMFAETFKYHFLLQSDPDLISLDDYVLNTEAHTLLANPDIKPGSQGLWKPILDQHLGNRAQGTDAQKWLRLDHLQHVRRPFQTQVGHDQNHPPAAGKGMGGGGGSPDFKPKAPLGLGRPKANQVMAD